MSAATFTILGVWILNLLFAAQYLEKHKINYSSRIPGLIFLMMMGLIVYSWKFGDEEKTGELKQEFQSVSKRANKITDIVITVYMLGSILALVLMSGRIR